MYWNRCVLLTDGRQTSLQTARVRFQTYLSICSYWNNVEQIWSQRASGRNARSKSVMRSYARRRISSPHRMRAGNLSGLDCRYWFILTWTGRSWTKFVPLLPTTLNRNKLYPNTVNMGLRLYVSTLCGTKSLEAVTMKIVIFTCKSDTWCQGNAYPIGLYIADLHI